MANLELDKRLDAITFVLLATFTFGDSEMTAIASQVPKSIKPLDQRYYRYGSFSQPI